MRRLPFCRRCQFYAYSSFLVCALHPQGISEENNCSDFKTANETFYRENRFEPEDLSLAEGLLLNQGNCEEEAHHSVREMMAEMYYDSTKDLWNPFEIFENHELA